MGWGIRALFLVAVIATPVRAFAQPVASVPQFSRTSWDAGTSFGFVWGDFGLPDDNTHDNDFDDVAYNFDFGRFWGTHFKTDFGLQLTPSRELYDYNPFGVPGVGGTYTYTTKERRFTGGSVAATYQFFENEMMHPYVSGGVQVGVFDDHLHRNQEIRTVNRITYTIPGVDSHETETFVRPFFAAGTKSYFNERTYVRSEFLIAVGGNGFSHATVRLGFGFDF